MCNLPVIPTNEEKLEIFPVPSPPPDSRVFGPPGSAAPPFKDLSQTLELNESRELAFRIISPRAAISDASEGQPHTLQREGFPPQPV